MNTLLFNYKSLTNKIKSFGKNVNFWAKTSILTAFFRFLGFEKNKKVCYNKDNVILGTKKEVMNLKMALVDDERIYLDEMARLCREFGEENRLEIEISKYSDGDSFLRSDDEYSVVFMDIYMNGSDGVMTAKKLRERDSGCILIFLTSSIEHMPDAFSCHAFEYIVKPFSPQRVKEVLNDAIKIIPIPSKFVELYSDRKTVRIALGDIVSAMTDAHYLEVELVNGTSLRCRMTAGQFVEQTNKDGRFILVNKGIIVNIDYITDFENNCCILENGSRLPIRVRDRLKIEHAVRDYNFDKIRSCQPGPGCQPGAGCQPGVGCQRYGR